MGRGPLGLIGLAGTLIFALPAGLLGLEFLLFRGKTVIGLSLIVTAVLMVKLQDYVKTPDDVAGEAAEKAVGKVAKTSDDEE
jgi:hypothetical protein